MKCDLMPAKKLEYDKMIEKLLRIYYSNNKEAEGFIQKALRGGPKTRKLMNKALKLLNKESGDLDSELIRKAFWYSKKKHSKQKRLSGEPYFIHPYNTAIYLAEIKMDAPSIAAGLLHDVIEDTETELSEIKTKFGGEVGSLVKSLTKLKQIVSASKRKENNVFLHKILFATTKDVRVIIIKLADKRHNLLTLKYLPKDKQKIIAEDVLDFYIPLAKKLGLHELQDEFEKICFKLVKPKIYVKIKTKVEEKRKKKEAEMDLMTAKLQENISNLNLNASFSKYERTIYSIFKKMTQNLKSLSEIEDSVVLIVLTDTKEQCYEFLGILHNTFSPVPLKFRDHMSVSQFSFYKSIHTTVMGPKHSPVKFYIRTREMDYLVRFGLIQLLKEAKSNPDVFNENICFLNDLSSIDFQDLSSESFINVLKSDYLQDRIFVFTREGKLIELPRGASVVDAAYALSIDIGNNAVKGKVNGQLVPLWHKLKNGDLIEVMAGKKKRVSRLWNTFAISVKARNEIQKHLKVKKREKKEMRLVTFEFRALDRIGLIKDFAEVFFSVNANIFSAEIRTSDESGLGKDSFTLELSNPKKLEALMKKLKKIKGVIEIKTKYVE
ncbi:HD domain-containing protein [Candidatus Micrarchaeota archaeon]|nr:HD domain-containing protein [Candidatus Micrarchaeota archaeon]